MKLGQKAVRFAKDIDKVSGEAWWHGFLGAMILLAAWSEFVGRSHLDYRAGLLTMLFGMLASAWLNLDEQAITGPADKEALK